MSRSAFSFVRRAIKSIGRKIQVHSSKRRFRIRLRELPATGRSAVIVAMPGSVQLAQAALGRLVGHIDLICVLNGLDIEEKDWLKSRFADQVHFLESNVRLKHHDVIEALIRSWDEPFWLIDHDCFVIDPKALLNAENASIGRAGAVFYGHQNNPQAFWKPHTFIMLIRPKAVRAIAKMYKVPVARTTTWSRLPEAVHGRLRTIGIDEANLPESYKNYFDTLCLVTCLAEADGVGWHAFRKYEANSDIHPEVIHIGHTSNLEFKPEVPYIALGAYFWRLSIEAWQASSLKERYLQQVKLPSLEQMKRDLLRYDVQESLLESLKVIANHHII